MSATTQGSKERHATAETSDGSARTGQETVLNVDTAVESEKPTEVTAGSTGPVTDDELLDLSEDISDKGYISSDTSTHTVVPENLSENYSDFKQDLPTRVAGMDQTPLAKGAVVKCDKPEVDEGKSEKIVQVEAMTESFDTEMASKPLEVKDYNVVGKHVPCSSEEKFGLMDEQFVLNPNRITMLTKGYFKQSKHVQRGRYYLPELPVISIEGRKSMLLNRLRQMATFIPCAASYQRYFSEPPMIRLNSNDINDFKPLKILYWDTSFLLVNEGKPVGVKVPTDISVEWLDSRIGSEKNLVDRSKCMDLEIDWGIIIVPNTTQFLNILLFFKGHLDTDLIKDVETPTDPTTDKLADSFMKLGSQCAIVNVSSNKESELSMDTVKPATVLKVPATGASQYDNGSVKTTDDINKSMTNEAIDVLHLDSRGA